MPSNILVMNLSATQNIPILIGNTTTFTLTIQNISPSARLYNLGLALILPNGMSLSSATIPQTSSVTNADNSTSYSWVNLKDLAPLEIDYTFSITVKCNNTFKNGSTIPFDYLFSNVSMQCQVDTMPRGIYDIGNEILTQSALMSFITVRFSGTVTTPGKVLKGAGTSLAFNNYTQVQTATCKFYNNTIATSLVDIIILIDDGIRYLGNCTASGTDASQFQTPLVNTVTLDGKNYIQLFFGGITLSKNTATTLTFNYAIWNYTNNNQGNFIPHGTRLNLSLKMVSSSYTFLNSFSFAAMDLILTTSLSKTNVDVQNSLTYTYAYAVGGYYDMQNIVVNYQLPDGIYYISSSLTPTSVINNAQTQGYLLTYQIATIAVKNSITTITIAAKVNSYYQYKLAPNDTPLPIVSFDSFKANGQITATPITLLLSVMDTASVSCSINVPTIKKQFVRGYYQNGTQKNIATLAPLDKAEYLLIYTATSLSAMQKQIYIDDFFPLAADPIENLSYTFGGYQPIQSPQLISPHGIDFYYGDIPGKSDSSISFKVPISLLGAPSQNINLMKFKGINTAGYSYSGRAQVTINIGTPNLQLTKSVSGPNPSAVKSGETYTYTVKITNTNTLGTETDAFNFILTDNLSSWFTLKESTINVSGSGSYTSYSVSGNAISVAISKLAPGQSLTLTYSVILSDSFPPGLTIVTTATNNNPYAQAYQEGQPNFQYTGLVKTASVNLSSIGISLAKTTNIDTFKVGSTIVYTITLTVPLGTIAYGVYVKDTLSSGNQVYLGPSYRNGTPITPSVSSNVLTFPAEGTMDARTNAQVITYIFYCKINNGSKSLNATTSNQTNSYQCFYQQVASGNVLTITKSLGVTINHPNIVMALSCADKTTAISYTQTAPVSIYSTLQFTLIFQNNSAIDLLNGTLQIPLGNNFIFSTIDTTTQCTGSYSASTKNLTITIPRLNAGMTGMIIFTLLPQSNLHAGASTTLQATAISYYNTVSITKVYSGEKSNTLTVTFPPGVSLLPNPLTQINDTTSFTVTLPGNTASIINYFKNTGGGYDDYTLKIAPVAINYALYIDDVKIADIFANTAYEQSPSIMQNLAPNTARTIMILAPIPITSPLGSRYDFVITATSKTTPYPSRTVLNIDPS
ncbi:MAG: isopeptide-forming domain-containing fimbrial protein [Cellulosilyticaceae bacterium]